MPRVRSLRIAINALSGQVGGGVTGFRFLLPALGRLKCHDEFHVILSRGQPILSQVLPPGFKAHFVSFDPTSLVKRAIFEQLVLPVVLGRLGIDVLYSVGNTTSICAPCKVVLLIENCNPYSRLKLPWSLADRIRLRLLSVLGTLSAWRADRVRFVSENSRNHLCNQLGIPKGKTVVIYHGNSPILFNGSNQAKDGPMLPEKFILTVSTLAPHKNIERLMSAFNLLVERHGYPGALVIIGSPWFPAYAKELDHFRRTLEYGGRIRFVGEKSSEELAAYYRGADVFISVSLAETFGLPVVEALGYGTSVIVGRCPRDGRVCFNPFEEICKDAAAYCDPFEIESIAKSLNSVVADPAHRSVLSQQGLRRAADFDWDDVARRLHQFMRSALEKSA